jgi:hypothetical protein
MQAGSFFSKMPKFKTPQEELEYLRAYIIKHEEELRDSGHTEHINKKATGNVLRAYRTVPAEKALHKSHILDKETHKKIISTLQIEPHNTVIEELLGLMITRGVRNSLTVVEVMNNPYIDADFHYFLIQYLKDGKVASGK